MTSEPYDMGTVKNDRLHGKNLLIEEAEDRIKIDKMGHIKEDGKELNEVPTVNLNKVDKLSETEIMWKHFEEMELDDQKKKRLKDDGKGKEPIVEPTTKDVKSIEEMVIFLDLLTAVNENLLQEEFVKIKFNKMVKWFNKYVRRMISGRQ
ncbi:hypothetical protein R6Q57_006268 [Mikania cordata]